MYTFIKRVMFAVIATASMAQTPAVADPSRSALIFEGFLSNGDGAVWSEYGYSRQKKEVYVSINLELPGQSDPFSVTRRQPSKPLDGNYTVIRALSRTAVNEVVHLIKRHGGIIKGHRTFNEPNFDHEWSAADKYGNRVEILSKPSHAKECHHDVLNDNGRVQVKLNEVIFSIIAPSKNCLVRGFVSGMWSKEKGQPATVASFIFLSEDGDQYVYLVHERPAKGFFAEIARVAGG